MTFADQGAEIAPLSLHKTCPRCKVSYARTVEYFGVNKNCGSKDGLSYVCRPCYRLEKAAVREKNRERQNAYNLENYHKKRRERGLLPRSEKPKRSKEYRQNYIKNWRSGPGKDWAREYINKRRQDPVVRLRHTISVQMRNAIKSGKGRRSWINLVGYTPEELKAHIENQFDTWMTWENYGFGWHIDHIKPIVSFDLPKEIAECWALSNLRPLSAKENMSKGAKIINI